MSVDAWLIIHVKVARLRWPPNLNVTPDRRTDNTRWHYLRHCYCMTWVKWKNKMLKHAFYEGERNSVKMVRMCAALLELSEPLACWRLLPYTGQLLPLLRPLFNADWSVVAEWHRQEQGRWRRRCSTQLWLRCARIGRDAVPLWPPVGRRLYLPGSSNLVLLDT